MPRKNPLPQLEAAIGARLKQFREERLISQTQFAAELRISRAQLINYEEGISPLPWQVAERLVRAFGLNPRWLATGKVPMDFGRNAKLPRPSPEKFSVRAPFSSVYLGAWQDAVESETLRRVTFGFDSSQPMEGPWHEIIELAAAGWLQRIPNGKAREFFLELSTEAERIVNRICSADK